MRRCRWSCHVRPGLGLFIPVSTFEVSFYRRKWKISKHFYSTTLFSIWRTLPLLDYQKNNLTLVHYLLVLFGGEKIRLVLRTICVYVTRKEETYVTVSQETELVTQFKSERKTLKTFKLSFKGLFLET